MDRPKVDQLLSIIESCMAIPLNKTFISHIQKRKKKRLSAMLFTDGVSFEKSFSCFCFLFQINPKVDKSKSVWFYFHILMYDINNQ